MAIVKIPRPARRDLLKVHTVVYCIELLIVRRFSVLDSISAAQHSHTSAVNGF